jgi:glycosyltransferase involved in cell wall biosynthesis
LKILHLYKDYWPVRGGIEATLRQLARGQAERGHEVTALVANTAPTTDIRIEEGVRVVRAARLATVASTPLSVVLPLWVRRLSVDVAHLHFPYPLGETAFLLFGHARRTVVTYHADIVRQRGWLRLYEPMLRALLRRADRVLATSEAYARSSPYLQDVAAKISIVPSAVEVDRFAWVDPAKVAALRARVAPPGAPIVLSVGRLRYYKGLDTLIHSMKTVPAILVVVGTGPMSAAWRSLADELGVADRVVFAGEVNDAELPTYYHAADVYVSSASHRAEAYGLSILEAMASGLPAVTTEIGTGTSFVNLEGQTGRIVPPRNPESMSVAIRELLADAALRARLGAAARARTRNEFSVEGMIEKVEAVYQSLLG